MNMQAVFNRDCSLWALCFLLIYMSFAQHSHASIVPGGCSRTCSKTGSMEMFSSLRSHCSCSSSCAMYGDCCYDSRYRTDNHKARSEVTCLTVSGKGQFKFVSKCRKGWTGSSEFCSSGIGHLPPVTSRKTGTSYANYYCALCNEDTHNVVKWKSEIRCCPEHHSNSKSSPTHYVYSGNHLWSILKTNSGVSKRCLCRLHLPDDADDFIKQMELRRCEDRTEIDTCSFTWRDEADRSKCKSYLDPVYLGNKVYRNVHCAQCNYESMVHATCRPPLVERMIREGRTESEIQQYCVEHQLTDCVRFFGGGGKGGGHSLMDIFVMNSQSCIPPPGRRCCEGMKYDFRSKQCRNRHRRHRLP